MQNRNHSTFFEKNIFRDEILVSIEKLKENLLKTNKMFSETRIPLEKDSYHAMTRFLVPQTKIDKILYSHIFRTALQTEKMSAGSSYVSILASIAFIEILLRNEDFLNKNEYQLMEHYQERGERFYNNISSKCKLLTQEVLEEFILASVQDDKLKTSINESIKLSGLEGIIQVENSHNENYSVEAKNGYKFPVKIFKPFLGPFGTWNQVDVKFFLVDGILEKVSEIDKILNKSFQTKIPLVIAAQGFSEEILGTLKINNDAKKLNVFPIVVGNDLESLNLLNDISVVTGSRVISTLNGDMVIFADYDDLPLVDYVMCNENGLLIKHSKNEAEVSQQINTLVKRKLKQSNIVDIGVLFDKRITNLLSHTISLNLPDVSETENEALRTKIDVCLRTVKSLVSHGYLDKDNLKELKLTSHEKDPFVESINKAIEFVSEQMPNKTKFPALSVALGIHFAGKTVLQFLTSNGVVVLT